MPKINHVLRHWVWRIIKLFQRHSFQFLICKDIYLRVLLKENWTIYKKCFTAGFKFYFKLNKGKKCWPYCYESFLDKHNYAYSGLSQKAGFPISKITLPKRCDCYRISWVILTRPIFIWSAHPGWGYFHIKKRRGAWRKFWNEPYWAPMIYLILFCGRDVTLF